MKNEKTVSEALRRMLWLKKNLKDITELKKEAFKVFSDWCSIEKMESNFNEYWMQLIYWTDNTYNIEKHFGYMDLDANKIQNAFFRLKNASISRKEFADTLEDSRENVERYIKELEAEISKEQEYLNELYDQFAQSSGDFSFIFKEPSIKQLIMDKFLQS